MKLYILYCIGPENMLNVRKCVQLAEFEKKKKSLKTSSSPGTIRFDKCKNPELKNMTKVYF